MAHAEDTFTIKTDKIRSEQGGPICYIVQMCTKSITDSLTYSIFSPCLGNPTWLTANTLTTLTLEIMNSISREGLQYYWVTCDERNHHSSSKYNFPETLNWYNQFKCSKKNIEKGWKLGSSQRSSRAAGCCSVREQNKQSPEMWLFSETHIMFVMWMGYFGVITMWLSCEHLRSTQICANARRTIHKLFQCQDLCENTILFGLTCLRRHASRTRRHLPWWCGNCRLESDHWGRWPLVQPACGWRSATVWWGCACRNEDKKAKKIENSHLLYRQSE